MDRRHFLLLRLHAFSCLLFLLFCFPFGGTAFGQDWSGFLYERLHLGVTGRHLQCNNLIEPHAFSPVAGRLPPDIGWRRTWNQQDWYGSLRFDPLAHEHVLLGLGVHLGVSQGRFSARRTNGAFTETWRTEPALLWGPFAGLELRAAPDSGPFLELRYDLFMAQADERGESIVSRPGQAFDPDHRHARFRWTRHEGTLAAGWRFETALGVIAPKAGARWRHFKLAKSLSHSIPLTDPLAADADLVRALNAVPSEYRYGLSSRLAPLLGVHWRLSPHVSLEAAAILSRDQDFSLSLSLSL